MNEAIGEMKYVRANIRYIYKRPLLFWGEGKAVEN